MDGPAWVDFGEMTNSSHRLSKEEIELIYIKAEYIMDAERTICRGNETLHPYIYGTYLGDLDEGDYLSYPQLCRYYTLSVDHGDGTGTGYYIDTRIRPVVHLKNTVKTTGKDENGAWIIVDE